MTYYHKRKEDAAAAAAVYVATGLWEARSELEPNNGWVIVLRPTSHEVYKYPLYDLLDVAELELGLGSRVRRRPASYKRPPSVVQVRNSSKASTPPPPPPAAPPPPKPKPVAAPPPPPPPRS